MLSDLPSDDRRGANAWALLLRECDQGTTDLEIIDLQAEFTTASIEQDIGYNEDTIIKYSRLLNSINARLPAASKYDNNALCVKILSNIIHPEPLALEAVTELRAAAGSRRFEHQIQVNGNLTHERDYRSLITHFDAIWRGLSRR